MRRAAPSTGLSPRLVKHFAIATVTLTALLALFASGEDWGAQAQLEAVDAKNRLAAAEAEKLGSKRIQAKLKVRKSSGGGSMAGDGGSDMGTGGGGGGSLYPEPAPRYAASPRPGGAPQTEFGKAAAGPDGNRPPGQAKQQTRREPTQEELEAMLEASRQRSGSSSD